MQKGSTPVTYSDVEQLTGGYETRNAQLQSKVTLQQRCCPAATTIRELSKLPNRCYPGAILWM